MTTTTDRQQIADVRIELLTASVQTLQVGARQVTLSIAKQLDHVPLTDIKIMGRVRLGSTRTKWGESIDDVQVIGSDLDGRLVLAHITEPPRADALIWVELGESIVIAHGKVDHPGTYRIDYRGVTVLLSPDSVRVCDCPVHPAGNVNGKWLPEHKTCDAHYELTPASDNEIGSIVELSQANDRAQREAYDAANAAPLIVLADLR